MKKSIIYINLFLVFISCSERYQTKISVSDVIPKGSHTVIKVNAFNDFKILTTSNHPFSELKVDSIINKLEFLNTSSPIYICIADSSSAVVSKYSNVLIKKDSISYAPIPTSLEDEIYTAIYKKDTLYYRIMDDIFFGSFDLRLTKRAAKEDNKELEKLLLTSDDSNLASVIFKDKNKNTLLLRDSNSMSYDIIDINSERNTISFNGVTKSSDSLFRFNAFKNTSAQEFKISEIIPENTKSLNRIAFDDFTIFYQNLSKFNSLSKDSIPSFLNTSNEIALLKLNLGEALVIRTIDDTLLEESFEHYIEAESFKGIRIFKDEKIDIFKDALLPFMKLDNTAFGFTYESFIVFSNDIEILRQIISNKLNNQTLFNSDKFKSLNEKLARESSQIIYKDGDGLYDFLNRGVKGYNASVIQYVHDNNFTHINGMHSKYKKPAVSNSISDDFSVSLESEILSQPQILKNHRTSTFEIAVQDIANNLYLISNSGKIIWKKRIDGAILGKIKQIDIYKNNRLQMVFATSNKVHIIDRNGKDVGPFPKKFNDEITQPLSVFDYDSNKNYRLLVTQGKSLIIYDVNAKRVSGFKYKKAANVITKQPKHFRIGNKDYIVFTHGKKLEILNRQGQERISVKRNISFSENTIFLYQNKFTTLNKDGQLVQVDTKGGINIKDIGLKPDSKLKTTSKTLVALDDNKLKIKSKSIDLDFGNYTPPEIFYLNDKIYVTTTDLQTKKIYMFDSQAKLLPNFPIYGTTSATLKNLDKKRDLELITQSDEKTLLVYKIN